MRIVSPHYMGQKERQWWLCPGTLWISGSTRIFAHNFMCSLFPLHQNLPLLCCAQKPWPQRIFFQRIIVPSQNTFATPKWHEGGTEVTAPSWQTLKLSFVSSSEATGVICVGGWVDVLEGPIIIILRERKCLHVGFLFPWMLFQRQ